MPALRGLALPRPVLDATALLLGGAADRPTERSMTLSARLYLHAAVRGVRRAVQRFERWLQTEEMANAEFFRILAESGADLRTFGEPGVGQ